MGNCKGLALGLSSSDIGRSGVVEGIGNESISGVRKSGEGVSGSSSVGKDGMESGD